ncbi:MAG: SBBP repeat-containing protein [Bryobacteraceae bacterium]
MYRLAFLLANLAAFGLLTPAAFGSRGTTVSAKSPDLGTRMLERLPLRFEPNEGQLPPEVRFLTRSSQRMLFLTDQEAIVPLRHGSLKIRPVHANPKPEVEGVRPFESTSTYIRGNDRSQWRSSVPHFGGVRYREVYPGIDLLYRGQGRQVEYDFYVAPGADPGQIRLQFTGADKLWIDGEGALHVRAGGEELRQPVPFAFQDDDNREGTRVEASYRIVGKREVEFRVGEYDRDQKLVIDPVLIATYFGGASVDVATNVAVDSSGAVWVTGYSSSPMLPVTGIPFREEESGNVDLFIAKFNPTLTGGSSLQYATYYGGDGEDRPTALTIDPQGFLLVAGYTTSTNFPLAGNNQAALGGDRDAFLVRFSTTDRGTDALWYATYFGGDRRDVALAVAGGPGGRAYIAGYTTQIEGFPLTGGPLQGSNRGGYDTFLVEIETLDTANAIRYATFLGGSSTDVATGLALDAAGRIWMAGYTMSSDFPTTAGAYRESAAGRGDIFLARVDRSRDGLDALDYATYLGGSDTDVAYGMVMDSAGRMHFTGYTFSSDFPVTADAHRAARAGATDAIYVRFDPAAADPLSYSTYLGGGSTDVGYGLALDATGKVAITGYTHSNDFPIAGGALQPSFGGASDAFVAFLDPAAPAAASLIYSSYLGGNTLEAGNQIALDGEGNMYMVGSTTSRMLSTGSSVFQPDIAGLTDAFVVRLNLCADEEACREQGLLVNQSCQADQGFSARFNAADAACVADDRGGFICSRTVCASTKK